MGGRGMSTSIAAWQHFMDDEPEHREHRRALARRAKHGDRDAVRAFAAEYDAWLKEWDGRMGLGSSDAA
jgi:hypothetical protein